MMLASMRSPFVTTVSVVLVLFVVGGAALLLFLNWLVGWLEGRFDTVADDEMYGWCDGCDAEYVLGSDDHDGENGLCWGCSRKQGLDPYA